MSYTQSINKNKLNDIPEELIDHVKKYVISTEGLKFENFVETLGKMVSLDVSEDVDLSYSNITDIELFCYGKAEKINLSHCKKVTDNGIKNLCKAITCYNGRIHTIKLNNCYEISGKALCHLNRFVSRTKERIYVIGLSGCHKIANRDLEYLDFTSYDKEKKGLHEIDLSYSKVTDKELRYFRGVYSINLSHCEHITDEGLGKFPTLNISEKEYLREVKLDYCKQITDLGLLNLVRFSSIIFGNISSLSIVGCNNITDRGIRYLTCGIVKIFLCNYRVDRIDLSYCERIADNALWHLGPHNFPDKRGVRDITLARCLKVTDLGLSYLNPYYSSINDPTNGNKERQLYRIELNYCPEVTDKGFEYLQGVDTVIVKNCDNITDKGLWNLQNARIVIIEKCKKITNEGLKYLSLADSVVIINCEQITNNGLQHLQNVKTVGLRECQGITDEGLPFLRGNHCVILNGCNGITEEGIEELKKYTKVMTLGYI